MGVELEELSFRDHSRVWATVRILLRQCQELKAGAGLSDFWNILYLSMNYTDVLSSKGPGKGAQPRYIGAEHKGAIYRERHSCTVLWPVGGEREEPGLKGSPGDKHCRPGWPQIYTHLGLPWGQVGAWEEN